MIEPVNTQSSQPTTHYQDGLVLHTIIHAPIFWRRVCRMQHGNVGDINLSSPPPNGTQPTQCARWTTRSARLFSVSATGARPPLGAAWMGTGCTVNYPDSNFKFCRYRLSLLACGEGFPTSLKCDELLIKSKQFNKRSADMNKGGAKSTCRPGPTTSSLNGE